MRQVTMHAKLAHTAFIAGCVMIYTRHMASGLTGTTIASARYAHEETSTVDE